MRKPRKQVAQDGTRTYKVRFRSAGAESSRTFRRESDAKTFAALLDSGRNGVAEALGWLAAKEVQAETVTFGEFFADYTRHLTGITPRTRADYEAMHRRYLTSLDPLPLPLITRAHVAELVNDLERQGKSPKTIKNAIHMLSSCMNLAMDDRVIDRNPCRRVRLPKSGLGANEARFLTYEEFAVLVAAIPDHYKPLVVFLVGTGLRWSEATALQARHINLIAGTVTVRQAWKRVPGGFAIGPPKSAKANRTVNAATMALAAIEPLLGKPSDYVFTTASGTVVKHSNFYNRIWVPSCKKAGLDPRPRPHDCRHTHASWLISDGQSLEAIQDQLGHESIETTRRVYGHLLPAIGVALGKAASEAMDRALPHGMDLDTARRGIEPVHGSDESA